MNAPLSRNDRLSKNDVAEFWTLLARSLTDGTFLGATLSKRIADANNLPEKLTVRPISVKGNTLFQWASRWADRETHENLAPAATGSRIRELFRATYEHAHIFTADADFDLRATREGRVSVRRSRSSRSAGPLEHNRSKAYLIPENVPCAFLAEIGVMTPAGKVRASRHAKFRQINRFLELVDDVLEHLPPSGPLRVVDFGCGKSYLTFALHHLLTTIRKREVNILGFDRKSDVVTHCAQLGKKLGCRGLEFRVGEIAEQTIEGTVDLAVSLHACDTATDDALASAVAWQAAVILAVPCCQHELADRIHIDALEPLERHGILHEQFASLATDALRALALEACGYKTQIVEFIDLEHTAKNLLIRALRRPDRRRPEEQAIREYSDFKESLGLSDVAADRVMAAGNRSEVQSPKSEVE